MASFDPSEHIGEKLGCISIDSYDIEKEFFILFEKLTEDVLSVAKVVDKDAVKLQNASTKMEVSTEVLSIITQQPNCSTLLWIYLSGSTHARSGCPLHPLEYDR